MSEFREVTTRRVGDEVVEEVVEAPSVADQVVRTTRTTTDPVAPARVSTTTETVTPAPQPVRRRWWRRYRVPAETVATEYYAAPSYVVDPTLSQFFRIMWFALGVLEALLGLRFVLALFGANPNNEFASLVYGVTGPFVFPFRTLFATPAAQGSVFEFYTLIAMAVYFLLWWGIVRFIEVVANRPVDV
jgi:hypothetical protein